jgi:hypothetical protein
LKKVFFLINSNWRKNFLKFDDFKLIFELEEFIKWGKKNIYKKYIEYKEKIINF